MAAVVLVATGLLVNLSPGRHAEAAAARSVEPVRRHRRRFRDDDPGRARGHTRHGRAQPLRRPGERLRLGRAASTLDRIRLRFSPADRPDVAQSALELASARARAATRAKAPTSRWTDAGTVTVLVPRGVEAVEVPLELTTASTRAEGRREPHARASDHLHGDAGRPRARCRCTSIPATPGANELHVTFFDDDGRERSVDDLR